jgi:hypothetical protein
VTDSPSGKDYNNPAGLSRAIALETVKGQSKPLRRPVKAPARMWRRERKVFLDRKYTFERLCTHY